MDQVWLWMRWDDAAYRYDVAGVYRTEEAARAAAGPEDVVDWFGIEG